MTDKTTGTTPETAYPEHEKLKSVLRELEVISEFLDWARAEHGVFAAVRDAEDGDAIVPLSNAKRGELLARFFGCDFDALGEEKERMLKELKHTMSPKYPVGTRVFAVLGARDGVLRVFGAGTLIGNKNPKQEELPEPIGAFFSDTNPCIQLDDGKYVWGCECWWGTEKAIRTRFGRYEEEVTVDVDAWREEVLAQQREHREELLARQEGTSASEKEESCKKENP